jgi:hypothetical protein
MPLTLESLEVSDIFFKRCDEESPCDALQRMAIEDVRP